LNLWINSSDKKTVENTLKKSDAGKARPMAKGGDAKNSQKSIGMIKKK